MNRERLLFATLGALSTPETVREEVLRKARSDRRFERSASVLAKLPASLLAILSDDERSPRAGADLVLQFRSGCRREQRLEAPGSPTWCQACSSLARPRYRPTGPGVEHQPLMSGATTGERHQLPQHLGAR